MWNRGQTPKLPDPSAMPPSVPNPPRQTARALHIGKSVIIKGEVTGAEDLTIDGRVEGRIELHGHSLLIGPNAQINAQVIARRITIMGAITGNVRASET